MHQKVMSETQDLKDGSAIKSTCYSCRALGSESQHLCGGLYLSVIPAAPPTTRTHMMQTQVRHIYTQIAFLKRQTESPLVVASLRVEGTCKCYRRHESTNSKFGRVESSHGN